MLEPFHPAFVPLTPCEAERSISAPHAEQTGPSAERVVLTQSSGRSGHSTIRTGRRHCRSTSPTRFAILPQPMRACPWPAFHEDLLPSRGSPAERLGSASVAKTSNTRPSGNTSSKRPIRGSEAESRRISCPPAARYGDSGRPRRRNQAARALMSGTTRASRPSAAGGRSRDGCQAAQRLGDPLAIAALDALLTCAA